MALSPSPTLGAVRQRVLAGLSMGQQGQLDALIKPQLDEMIRTEQAHLYYQFHWTRLVKRLTVPVSTGQRVFDWPDDTVPGQIQFVYFVDDPDEPTKVAELKRGILPNERASYSHTSNGTPTRFTYVDRVIRVLPAPDADMWPYLIIEYFEAPNTLVGDNDTIAVDEQALVDATIIAYKTSLEEDTAREEMRAREYLEALQRQQSTGGTIHIGGNYAGNHPRNGQAARLARSHTLFPPWRTRGIDP